MHLTAVGWFTALAYIGAAFACWGAHAAQTARADVRRSGSGRFAAATRFWLWSTACMALLYLNKQFGLQDQLTDIVRGVSMRGGWYDRRQALQTDLVGGAVVAGLGAAAALAGLSWPLSVARAVALAGQLALVVLVLVRAVSLHRIDVALDAKVGGLRWNWIIELAGIALVAAGASQERRARTRSSTPAS